MWLKQLICNAPLRYVVVAIGGFTADFLLYGVLVATGLSIYVANVAGFCLGACINVILIRRFVFKASRFTFATDLTLTFMANGAMMLLGSILLWLMVGIGGANPYWSKLAANGITFVLNYATRATFFRRR